MIITTNVKDESHGACPNEVHIQVNAAEGPDLTRSETKCLLDLATWRSLMALTRYTLVTRLSGLKSK